MNKKNDGNRILLKGDYTKLALTKNIESHSYKMSQAKRPRNDSISTIDVLLENISQGYKIPSNKASNQTSIKYTNVFQNYADNSQRYSTQDISAVSP